MAHYLLKKRIALQMRNQRNQSTAETTLVQIIVSAGPSSTCSTAGSGATPTSVSTTTTDLHVLPRPSEVGTVNVNNPGHLVSAKSPFQSHKKQDQTSPKSTPGGCEVFFGDATFVDPTQPTTSAITQSHTSVQQATTTTTSSIGTLRGALQCTPVTSASVNLPQGDVANLLVPHTSCSRPQKQATSRVYPSASVQPSTFQGSPSRLGNHGNHCNADPAESVSELLDTSKADMNSPTSHVGLESMSRQDLISCLNSVSRNTAEANPLTNMVMMMLNQYNESNNLPVPGNNIHQKHRHHHPQGMHPPGVANRFMDNFQEMQLRQIFSSLGSHQKESHDKTKLRCQTELLGEVEAELRRCSQTLQQNEMKGLQHGGLQHPGPMAEFPVPKEEPWMTGQGLPSRSWSEHAKGLTAPGHHSGPHMYDNGQYLANVPGRPEQHYPCGRFQRRSMDSAELDGHGNDKMRPPMMDQDTVAMRSPQVPFGGNAGGPYQPVNRTGITGEVRRYHSVNGSDSAAMDMSIHGNNDRDMSNFNRKSCSDLSSNKQGSDGFLADLSNSKVPPITSMTATDSQKPTKLTNMMNPIVENNRKCHRSLSAMDNEYSMDIPCTQGFTDTDHNAHHSIDQPLHVKPISTADSDHLLVSSSCSPESRSLGGHNREQTKTPLIGYDGNPVTSSGRNKGQGKMNEPKFPCQVCGDIAAGFHCGAYVCEACKKFYLRCLKNDNNVLTCPKSQQCTISKDNRSHCQYCRFQKCMALGMYRPGREFDKKLKVNFRAIPCKVCQAPSSGFHFGAITCEGCKGFFRRMLKENLHQKFTCSSGDGCEITSANRTFCKSCRFNKCLAIGMTLEGTRLGRQSNSVKRNTLLAHQMQVALEEPPPKLLHVDEIKKEPLDFTDALYQHSSSEPGSDPTEMGDHLSPSGVKPDLGVIDDFDDVSLEIIEDFNFDASLLDLDRSPSKFSGKGKGDALSGKGLDYGGKGKGKGKGMAFESSADEQRTMRHSGKQDSFLSQDDHEDANKEISATDLPGSIHVDNLDKCQTRFTADVHHDLRFKDELEKAEVEEKDKSSDCSVKDSQTIGDSSNDLRSRIGVSDESNADDMVLEDPSRAARYYKHRWQFEGAQKDTNSSSKFEPVPSSSSTHHPTNSLPSDHLRSVPRQNTNSTIETTTPSTHANTNDESLSSTDEIPIPQPSATNQNQTRAILPQRASTSGIPGVGIYNNKEETITYLTKIYKHLAALQDKPYEQKQYQMKVEDCQHVWTWCMISFVRDACLILKYLKAIPGFRELPQERQVDLTQESIYPICLLFHAQRHDMATGKTPFFSLSEEEMRIFFTAFPIFSSMQNHFNSCGAWVCGLQMDNVEVALMNALLVLTTAADRESCKSKLAENLENLTESLMEYCDNKKPGRGGLLLSRLAELKRCNIEHQEMAMVMREEHPDLNHGPLWLEVYVQR